MICTRKLGNMRDRPRSTTMSGKVSIKKEPRGCLTLLASSPNVRIHNFDLLYFDM